MIVIDNKETALFRQREIENRNEGQKECERRGQLEETQQKHVAVGEIVMRALKQYREADPRWKNQEKEIGFTILIYHFIRCLRSLVHTTK